MLMNPWALILVVPVIMLLLAEAAAHSPGVVRISTGETMARLVGAKGFLTRRIPAILRALALCLLIIAFARPMSGVTRAQDRADVVDIMLCVDVSGSMKALDFRDPQGEFRDRLYITKAAVRDFIDSRKTKDTDRFGLDRLGLVLYAGFAWTQCPLTLDYGVLEHELALAHIDESDARKQGTAIGSALGLAVSRLRNSEAESKVIILLTDGQNNRGELHPLTAAQIAKDYGIRVYTIGAGAGGVTRIPVRTLFGGQRYRQIESPIDEEMLRTIAEATTGRYYRATDSESLEEAYKEINELETTEIDIGDFYEYEEGFVPYCLAGAFVMALSMFTRRRWFDPIP
jgi:Ca-activated chloride channel family protein